MTIRTQEMAPHRHKFQTLDALRGVAAIVVVIFHNRMLFGFLPRHGYLAVDLFFNLSGFVLSYSYQQRLDQGLSSAAFLRARIIRLSPLYFFALAFGVAGICLATTGGWLRLTWQQHLEFIALGLFLLPAHSAALPGMAMYPYNYPSWSLFLELLMNVGHALFLRRLRTPVLACICGGFALALIAIYLHSRNLDAGWNWLTLFTVGIVRVGFSYTCGMLLFRAWSSKARHVKLPASLLLLLTFAALVVPTPHNAFFALVTILFLIPAIIYSGAFNEPGKFSWRVFGSLGAASYAIYVLHAPFYVLFKSLWPVSTTHAPWAGLLMLAPLIAVSLIIDRFYDTPVRELLRNHA